MKKFIFSIFLVTFMFFSLGGTSSLAEEGFNVNVVSESNNIHVQWNEFGTKYELYMLNGETEELIYKGGKTQFNITNLEEGKFHKLKLVALENNKILDYVIINTTTEALEEELLREKSASLAFSEELEEEPEIYNPMSKAEINTYLSKSSITLEWINVPNDFAHFELFKDGEKLTDVQENLFKDTDIVEDEVYYYTVVGYKKLPEERIAEVKAELKESGIDYTFADQKDLFYEKKSLSAVVRASEKNVLPDTSQEHKDSILADENLSHQSRVGTMSSFTPPPGYGYALRYTTFIPLEYAPNPWCDVICTKYSYFSGDNRGFDFWSNDFRTRSDVYLTWDGSNKYAKLNPQIGQTKGYDENYNFIDSDYAPTSDIKIQNIEYGSDYIYHRMGLSSGIPLTTAPAIDAFYYAKVFEDGRGEYYGVHDKAPSHEFYIVTYPGGFYAPIHQATHKGFNNLFPHTAKEEFEVNFY
ncbi:DUF3238 domain-containing protein [Jeotgalibacillus sp. R-1-5s-1]|uniref:DUF3238 domain-containing protein n=1 Tax=Jeotgalibacillus sp. R-1-5s-1 TaxID=2555897 RepID=UPI00106D04A3|nr:DUF3238 domain-containing protein [Jeotgalibacillus sp. R-1-5s-1]TFD93143.1 DUF3238 domain-containing protein [Jeotgalibacillus sp. R-1-5s-1]